MRGDYKIAGIWYSFGRRMRRACRRSVHRCPYGSPGAAQQLRAGKRGRKAGQRRPNIDDGLDVQSRAGAEMIRSEAAATAPRQIFSPFISLLRIWSGVQCRSRKRSALLVHHQTNGELGGAPKESQGHSNSNCNCACTQGPLPRLARVANANLG